ncbi:MAG: hypothetical protein KDA91_13620 [Planctomycetaceae bacterium]|nr:hypothetical protein [Planctomycetaceae bacterium]
MKSEKQVSVELTGEPWRLHRMGMIPVGAAVHYFSKGVGATLAAMGILTLVCLMLYGMAADRSRPRPGGAPRTPEAEVPRALGTPAPEPPDPDDAPSLNPPARSPHVTNTNGVSAIDSRSHGLQKLQPSKTTSPNP